MNLDGRLLIERSRQVPEYEAAFQDLYGSEVSYGMVLDALAAFLRTLSSEDHPYLRFLDGDADALSAQARAGLDLFEEAARFSRSGILNYHPLVVMARQQGKNGHELLREMGTTGIQTPIWLVDGNLEGTKRLHDSTLAMWGRLRT